MELLASLTMLPNATTIVVVPILWEVEDCWSVVDRGYDMLLSACFEVFLVNQYQIVVARPVWENCNFGHLELVCTRGKFPYLFGWI